MSSTPLPEGRKLLRLEVRNAEKQRAEKLLEDAQIKLSVVVSDLFGPNREFGTLLSASYAKTDRRVDNIESVWDIIENAEGARTTPPERSSMT